MAAAVLFAPPTFQTIMPHRSEGVADENHTTLRYHTHHADNEDNQSEGEDSSPEGHNDTANRHEDAGDKGSEGHEGVSAVPQQAALVGHDAQTDVGSDLTNLVGRRVTLIPRRTLSLSPTPARAGDMMMSRNLRAARWLDFTDKDDDDGLYQPSSDSESEIGKKKSLIGTEDTISGGKVRLPRRTGSLNLGYVGGISKGFGTLKKAVSSMKRPLEVTLPCQEIQYLDISYQQVQFSPIARKKINYHPVPYRSIHYCEVSYVSERPVKRKPLSF